ncbi:MAG: hypothetical protein RIS09_513, partial [Actinomycetota bacterium]
MSSVLLSDEIQAALNEGKPVVALESTIISHGLPRPDNFRLAREFEEVVRSNGAIPATIAVIEGKICIGLSDVQLEFIATSHEVVKTSTRDLGFVLESKLSAATTVAATAHIATRAGIQVFATGGLGGV